MDKFHLLVVFNVAMKSFQKLSSDLPVRLLWPPHHLLKREKFLPPVLQNNWLIDRFIKSPLFLFRRWFCFFGRLGAQNRNPVQFLENHLLFI